MSRNGYENLIESVAVAELLLQARNIYPSLGEVGPQEFYEFLKRGGNSRIRGHIIKKGPDEGKLALEHSAWDVDNRIEPVDAESIDGVVKLDAVEFLLQQAQEVYRDGFFKYTPESFYTSLIEGNIPETKSHVTEEGKLTLRRKWVIDEKIEPVDCYNLMREGEDLVGAVGRLCRYLTARDKIISRHLSQGAKSPLTDPAEITRHLINSAKNYPELGIVAPQIAYPLQTSTKGPI